MVSIDPTMPTNSESTPYKVIPVVTGQLNAPSGLAPPGCSQQKRVVVVPGSLAGPGLMGLGQGVALDATVSLTVY
uniref:Uncharacterized protein n=1 Tax=Sphaerodactylus townsendi TaxID=933632 RepID=A0ACB8FHG7_9SAUR